MDSSVPSVQGGGESNSSSNLSCDYLVVGAGASGLSFIDTLLTRRPDVTVILVDKLSSPGGHWTKSYPFVKLHQPSCCYGVNSLPLGKQDWRGREPYDTNDRASGTEVCAYYERVVEGFRQTGRVRVFFSATFEGEADPGNTSKSYETPQAKIKHRVTTRSGESITIACTKLVTVETQVSVPGMREGPPFPVDASVRSVPLNDLPEYVGPTIKTRNAWCQHFLIVGGGKSGVDAITYLLANHVRHDQITWVVSQAMWYIIRDRLNSRPKPGRRFWSDGFGGMIHPVLEASCADEFFLNMERRGVAQRVRPHSGHFPRVFRGATIDCYELEDLRKLPNLVENQGRITSITADRVMFQDGTFSIPIDASQTLVVDCTTDNMHGYTTVDADHLFFNPHHIRLGPLTSLINPCHTSAQVAFLESEYDDTQQGDGIKNSFLFFNKGHELKDRTWLQIFIVMWYAAMKTDHEFRKCPNYRSFVLKARTDRQQPDHHGGLLGLLWAIFGPLKLLQKTGAFLRKMETGGYSDFPTHPLPGRPGVTVSPDEMEQHRRRQAPGDGGVGSSSKAAAAAAAVEAHPGTASDSATASSKQNRYFCCQSIDAVEPQATTEVHF